MNDQELSQFVQDYKNLSLGDLAAKYGTNQYWDTLQENQVFDFLKRNNQLNLMVEKDPLDNKHYYILYKHGSKYQFYALYKGQPDTTDIKEFETLEDAVRYKLKVIVNFFFSSLTRK